MYRFSRAIFVEIKDLVDPHPETVSIPEGKRRVLQSSEATIERLARDPHYFAKPSQSLFHEIRHLFSISNQAHYANFIGIQMPMNGNTSSRAI